MVIAAIVILAICVVSFVAISSAGFLGASNDPHNQDDGEPISTVSRATHLPPPRRINNND